MTADRLKPIREEQLTQGRYVHVPDQVHDTFKKEQSETNEGKILYHWSFDTKSDSLIISTYQLRDIESPWYEHTEWNPSERRIRVPIKAVNTLDLEIGDSVYFVAREDIESKTVPLFFIWDRDKMDKELLTDESDAISYLDRTPNF